MFEKLEAVEKRYEELTKLIADPEVISNQSEWQKLMKEHASIEDIVIKFREYKKVKQNMEEAEAFLADCMAVVVDSIDEVREYFEEEGVDVDGMSAEDLEEASEVFALPDGTYLIVEG